MERVWERVYLAKPYNIKDCNDCKWLNITENEQQLGIKNGYHVCKHYQQRLKHRTSRIEHDWFIYPCDECFKDNFANYSIRVL